MPGQTVRTPVNLSNVRNFLGSALRGRMYGAYLRVINVNHYTGIVHLRSTDTGRTLDMRCSDLR